MQFKIAIALDPNNAGAQLGLGAAYFNDRNYAEAVVPYETAAKLDPKSVRPVIYLADAYRMQRKIADAKAAYLRALRIDPRSPDALYWLGAIAATEQMLNSVGFLTMSITTTKRQL